MKKEFFAIALFLLISNIAFGQTGAQWPPTIQPGLGADGAGSDNGGRMMRRHMPDVQREHAPFTKGDEALAQTWDPNIANYGNNPDGMAIHCFAEDSDNLYIGGDFRQFDTVPANFIVHYNRKTQVWNALDFGVANTVVSLALHDGKLYAGGNFVHAGSGNAVVNFIAMWDGTAWNNLGGGMDNPVNTLAFIGDTLYAGGNFTHAGGNPASFLAFWDGHIWKEAYGGTSYPVRTLFATHDSLFVGGNFNYVGSETRNTGLFARGTAMLQNGNWTIFGGGFYTSTFALYHDTLWAGGDYFGTPENALVNCIAFWNGSDWRAIGTDTMVGTNATGSVYQLLTIGDTLLAVGNFSMMAGVEANGLAALHNGTWSEVAGGIYGAPYVAVPFDGKWYVGGRFTKAGAIDANAVAALSSNGTWTPVQKMLGQYVGWESDEVRAIATTDRYVFIGGNFTTIAGKTCNHVAAWDKQTASWITLGPGVDGDVDALAVLGNNLIVGGDFAHAGEIRARNIAMCNMTTKIWYPMGNGAHRTVGAIVADGSAIYASVYNILSNGQWFDYIGKWDGTNWNILGNGLVSGFIDALAWEGPTLFAAGSFSTTDDGTRVNGISQLQNGIWGALNSGLNYDAYALAVSGDSLYVGGGFTQADGQTDTALAVWNGTLWNPIAASGCNGPVYALASDGKGGIYAGGDFSEVAQVGRGRLVHWNGSTFGTVASGVNNTVVALATDASALYVGGWFESAGSNNTRSLHFAALDGAGASVTTEPEMSASLSIFPNPVSASSTITLELPSATHVRLELFNALGDRIAIFSDGKFDSGEQSFTFDGHALPNGLYFLRLMANEHVMSYQVVVEH